MADKFVKDIDRIVADTEAKMLDVARFSIAALIEDVQKTRAEGGRMRVDTGFLRWSALGSLNKIPSGQSEPRKRNVGELGVFSEYRKFGQEINPLLAKMKIGDIFYFGWTAKYARYREVYDGFLDVGVQKWSQFVDSAIRKVKK